METLPYIVAGIGVVCVAWVTDGQAIAPAMRRFGITLAAASAVILFGAVADAYRYAAVCDTFSGIHAALGLAVGAGFAAVTLPAAGASPIRRGVSVAGLAVIVLALAAALAPACLKGPYAQMDPRIVPIWLANITEAKTPFYFAERAPAFFVVGYLYAGLASAASIAAVFVVPRGRRRAALVAAAFSLAAFLVTSWQVRGLPFALLFAMPGLAALIVGGIARLRLSARAAMAACVIVAVAASDLGLPALAGGLAGRPPAARAFAGELSAMRRECFSSDAMSELRALSNGRVLAFANEGPAIMAHTGHSAVAGPYHRNAAGILDTYAAFTSPPDAARRIVQARGIDYVAVCLRDFDAARLRAAGGPGSLVALLLDGRPVAWLVPLPGARTVKIWRVVR
jgi:hypothetical protein